MKLSEKRILFSKLISQLVLWASEQGYDLAYDQVKRSEAEAKANAAKGTGISNSLHLVGLAADLNLYINGVYQESTEAHRLIGDKWKTMHPLARWGGDFKPRPDGNHYSLEHNGVK